MNWKVKFLGLIIIFSFLLSSFTSFVSSEGITGLPQATDKVTLTTELTGNKAVDYATYRKSYSENDDTDEKIILDMNSCTYSNNGDTSIKRDQNGISLDGDSGTLEWAFQVGKEGWYCLEFSYASLETNYSKITFSAFINGKTPYREWEGLSLKRPYVYDTEITNDFSKDSRGNDIKPGQRLSKEKITADLKDSDGKYNDPMMVHLESGTNTLKLVFSQADCVISGIRLHSKVKTENYKTYYDKLKNDGVPETSGAEYVLRAEKYSEKSDSCIQADYDKSSAATDPSSPSVMLLNKIGGTNWQDNGQWIEWKFSVEKSGFYCISFRARQNSKYGMNVLRRIMIDGQTPFSEMNEQSFPYNNNWYIKTLGDAKPYRFYLEAGREHVLRMEIVSGNYESVILNLTDILTELNNLYREIIMVTGTTPDTLRDYEIDLSIPDLISRLENVRNALSKQREYLSSGLIESGSETSYLDALIVQINGFLKDIDTVPYRLDSFKTKISSLADWIATLSEQPLELDSIIIHSENSFSAKGSAGIFTEWIYQLEVIGYSFLKDYGMIGNYDEAGETIDVWMNLGRDQLQVLKSMVDKSFSVKNNTAVNLSLVSGGLIEAVLAGKGPDAALFIGVADPVNLAARNAVTPLNEFEDFAAVSDNFYKNNLIPYQYRGNTYALPCTAEFPMMFVRTDVLEDLEIDIPKTWDDLIDTAAILQRKNLQIGIPSGASGGSGLYPVFLIQRGVTYYNKEQTATRFREEDAIDAFTMFTDFYTKYDFPLSYNFFNRFRTGEMPIGIDSYALYNYIQAAAPEISGLWKMVEVPSTRLPDGTLCGTTTNLSSSAAFILKTDKKQSAWDFLKWFVSTETQTEFGIDIEAKLGASGRYATANRYALSNLPWSPDQVSALQSQWANVTEMGIIPATYIVERNLSNAFKRVVYRGGNAREVLTTYAFTIDQEIERKNQEIEKRMKRG